MNSSEILIRNEEINMLTINRNNKKECERQKILPTADATTTSGAVGASSKSTLLWLVLWNLSNIGVTILNKASFQSVDFKYPYFLSFIHMACNSLGSQWVLSSIRREKVRLEALRKDNLLAKEGFFQRLLGDITTSELNFHEKRVIFLFSILFSLNIAIGNVSLRHVSVSFNQVMRSLIPAITIVMGMAIGKSFTAKRKLAVLPVVCGVAMACHGDMSYTALGLFYTVACVILAALKIVAAGEMLTGSLKLHPVDLLGYMAPLAMVQCLIMSYCTGETTEVLAKIHAFRLSQDYNDTSTSLLDKYYTLTIVFGSAVSSFCLNICSFMASKLTSPLTMCIASIVKQMLMVAISTIIFQVAISPVNGAGITVALLGSGLYSYVALIERMSPSNTAALEIVDKTIDIEKDRDIEAGNEKEHEELLKNEH